MNLIEVCRAFTSRDPGEFEAACEAAVGLAVQGLSVAEIAELTIALSESGEILELPVEVRPLADVPSTGGPASLSTLYAPLVVAATGCRVPKISATGSVAGAIDTLQLVHGFNAHLGKAEFLRALKSAGIAHIEQTMDLCPADSVLIATRRRLNVMRQPELATASLLAKKLVVPGTAAVFDFRIGRGGNIGDVPSEARVAAELFLQVAQLLGLKVAIALSDNRSFQCSALGRLESLNLLAAFCTQGISLMALDSAHRDACVEMAAMASELCGQSNAKDCLATAQNAVITGRVHEVLSRHLMEQGANDTSFHKALDCLNEYVSIDLNAAGAGYWIPPDVSLAREWVKKVQRTLDASVPLNQRLSPERQVGIRLLENPGAEVSRDQPVVQIRYPKGFSLPADFDWLSGRVDETPNPSRPQIIEKLW